MAAWIWGIGIHQLLHRLRPRGRCSIGSGIVRYDDRTSAEEQVLLGVQYGELGWRSIGCRPSSRAVVQATVLDGLTTKEAATMLGIPAGTVKTRMMRATTAAPGGVGMTRMARLRSGSSLRSATGSIGRIHAASVEAHLVCLCPTAAGALAAWARCRAHRAARTGSGRTITDEIDQPRP